jgi:Domain of unknown function (DUF4276)
LIPFELTCIVEGHGELEAVPVLVRRIAGEIHPGHPVRIAHPFRVPRSRLIKAGELERSVELAARRIGSGGGLLIILDSDDECPAALGPELLQRAMSVRPDLPISLVLAKREFEAWFLAAAKSLRGSRGLANDLDPPEDPETIRGAKEWLTARMTGHRHYVETLDQPALAAIFDLTAARRADSFDKLYRDVSQLLSRLGLRPESA